MKSILSERHARRLILSCLFKFESLLRQIYIQMPWFCCSHFPATHDFVSMTCVYVMLQAMALLWGFLFNAGAIMGENLLSFVKVPIHNAIAILLIDYEIVRFVLLVARAMWIMAWQSYDNFPYMRKVAVDPVNCVIKASVPILCVLCAMIVIPPVCETSSRSSPAINWICKDTYMRYLTNDFPVCQRSTMFTILIACVQYVQVSIYIIILTTLNSFALLQALLELFPTWNGLRGLSFNSLLLLGISLIILFVSTGIWILEWSLRHLGYKLTQFSRLSKSHMQLIGLILWVFWVVWMLVVIIRTLSNHNISNSKMLRLFRLLKVTFVFAQIFIFTRACFLPNMGFVAAQLELTIINFLLPLLYVSSLLLFRFLSLVNITFILIGLPVSSCLSYILYSLSDKDQPLVYFVFSQLLCVHILAKISSNESSTNPYLVRLSTHSRVGRRIFGHIIARKIVLVGAGVLTLFGVIMGILGFLSFAQNNINWYPETAYVNISYSETGKKTLELEHAKVAKLKLQYVNQMSDTTDSIKPREPFYSSCGNKWFNLPLVDYALLSQAAYFDPSSTDFKLFMDNVFPRNSSSPSFEIRIPSVKYRNSTIHRGIEFFEAYSKELNTSVISVRGTDIGRFGDFVEDAKMYSEPVVFTVLSLFFPTIRIWPDITFSALIELYHDLSSLLGLQHRDWYYQSLLEYAGQINDRNVVLTGHSMGGGIARIVSSMLGKTSITFSPPGVTQSYSKLVHNIGGKKRKVNRRRLHHQSVVVIPDYDPITMVDTQVGMIQRISCNSHRLSMQLSCHMIEGTICDLLHHCGDDKKRFSKCDFSHQITNAFGGWFYHYKPAPSTICGCFVFFSILFTVQRTKQKSGQVKKKRKMKKTKNI